MAVRPIDANELYRIEKLLDTDIVRQDKVALNLLEQVLYDIQHVPTLTPPNEWVSVEESLPEEKQRVIVRCERVGTSVGWILWGNWMTDIGPGAGKVTHWMPLPAPPGKDNNVPAKAPNEPLTLERLREMDGQPVYIVFLPDVTGEKLQFWALVDVDAFGDVNLTNNLGGSSPYEEVMGNIEAIYRRPPEGEENA